MAVLHIDALAKEDNLRDLRKTLQSLPEDLSKTYEDALQRINSQDRRKAQRAEQVLLWINFAFEPMRIDQLQHAVAIRLDDKNLGPEALPKEEALIPACCGLVVVDLESRIVRLVHYTAEEYFAKIRQDRYPSAHLTIYARLISYLRLDVFAFGPFQLSLLDTGRVEDRSHIIAGLNKNYPILHYASDRWGYHAREAFHSISPDRLGELGTSLDSATKFPARGVPEKEWLEKLILEYLQQDIVILGPRQVQPITEYCYLDEESCFWHWDIPRIHVLAAFDPCHIAEKLLDDGCDPDQRNQYGVTALLVAVKSGHIAMIQLLLKRGARIDKVAFWDGCSWSRYLGVLPRMHSGSAKW